MSDSIQSVFFNKVHQLTTKSIVSAEMPLATQQLQSSEGMPAVASLELDFLRVEALLTDMREIRKCLEQSLHTLIPGE
ncbi:hypothetical protein [Candidatus Chlamydia sanziniae]|uniref:Uncharacterized protein n=1 Tax=Candidatus Chlamydia sanziniae TaxID=1806891 RepID=A0A1A9HUR8_9CHLA|nr:hypothetical protein [Candidatus Chlamydia sanziniae]ANH78575.1 hypothetical protein Cs308_0404 [Candidatus Chlamydia sanziniae]